MTRDTEGFGRPNMTQVQLEVRGRPPLRVRLTVLMPSPPAPPRLHPPSCPSTHSRPQLTLPSAHSLPPPTPNSPIQPHPNSTRTPALEHQSARPHRSRCGRVASGRPPTHRRRHNPHHHKHGWQGRLGALTRLSIRIIPSIRPDCSRRSTQSNFYNKVQDFGNFLLHDCILNLTAFSSADQRPAPAPSGEISAPRPAPRGAPGLARADGASPGSRSPGHPPGLFCPGLTRGLGWHARE